LPLLSGGGGGRDESIGTEKEECCVVSIKFRPGKRELDESSRSFRNEEKEFLSFTLMGGKKKVHPQWKKEEIFLK